jgi:isocitrate dehydrogenase (NAD+)
VQFAFDYAERNARKRITLGHKANIMKFSDGVFLRTALAEAERHTHVDLEEMQMDELAMWLTWEPETMDVLLLPNLYGDIVSDLCAGLVGGLGLAPGANLGWEYALFEPVHGSAPDIAGKGLADPVAAILSSAMMLRHLREVEAARVIERAVDEVLSDGASTTRDLGGTASTDEMARAIAAAVRAAPR